MHGSEFPVRFPNHINIPRGLRIINRSQIIINSGISILKTLFGNFQMLPIASKNILVGLPEWES